MNAAGNARLRFLIAAVNLGWAVWALTGGIYFLEQKATLGKDPYWSVFSNLLHGYEAVGISLLLCGAVSLLATLFHKLRQAAAILCAVWCGVVAAVLQFATPGFDQGDIYAWLLLLCAFTCVCRWALLVLEPHVCQ